MSRAPGGAESWDVAVISGLVRFAAAGVLLRWPARLARLAGARPDDRVVTAAIAGFGARDLALGVTALAATRPGRDVRRQLRVQAGADVVDAVVVGAAVATGRLPKGRGIVGVAIGLASAASLAATAARLPAR
jgi:hypothetical protein